MANGGLPVIRRNTWWNFYRRGLALANREDWADAIEYFRIALGTKPGSVYPAFQDARRAKTYGLHFLDDYFPHRELGICQFHLGRLNDARDELQLSLEMTPSARAKFYLNLVRRSLLLGQRQRGQLPASRPSLKISGLPANGYIRDPFLRLQGTIASPYWVAEVRINQRDLFIEQAPKTYRLDHRLELSEGPQSIQLEVEDLAGNRAVWQGSVTVDSQGPFISVTHTDASSQEVSAEIGDEQELAGVEINGQAVDISAGQRTLRRKISLSGQGKLKIRAWDRAGNETELSSRLGELRKSSLEYRELNSGRRLAFLGTGAAPPKRTVQPLQPPISLGKSDRQAPHLRLLPEIPASVSVTTETYVLDVLAQDSGGLQSVKTWVNGRICQVQHLQRPYTLYRRSQRIALQPGQNTVKLQIRDCAGNTQSRTLKIERQMDCLWCEDLRMAVSLPPLDMSALPALKPLKMHWLLQENLLRHPRRLNLLERNPRLMEEMLLESRLGEGDLSSLAESASKVRPKAAEWLLQGYLSRWPGKNNWDLVLNVVEVETGEKIFTSDIHCTDYSLVHVRTQIGGLIDKIKQQLPALSSSLLRVERGQLDIPLGQSAQIVPGMRFVFVPRNASGQDLYLPPRHQSNGDLLQGKVTRVGENSCTVKLLSRQSMGKVQVDDLAVLR
jgi:tetratricopeptide (TPR) repeat protein